MLNSLRLTIGAVTAMVLGVVGGVTYLASQRDIAGTDALTTFVLILSGLGFTGIAHIVTQNGNTPPPPPSG